MIIGILGAGQLGRMLALAGIPLGFRFVFYDKVRDPCAAALGRVYRRFSSFARAADIYTYEFENVPQIQALELARERKLFPSYEALKTATNRRKEKKLFASLDIPTVRWLEVNEVADLHAAGEELGFPFIIKTTRLGYNGNGQRLIHNQNDLRALVPHFFGVTAKKRGELPSYIAEEQVQLKREISLIAARDRNGTIAFYPPIENVHRSAILYASRAPARLTQSSRRKTEAWMTALLEKLSYVGVMAVEFFDTPRGLLVNEMAPRVHNSGHWTMEGTVCSQFTNHILAISGLPLGDTKALGFSTMLNFIGRMPTKAARKKLFSLPGAYLHDYDKEACKGRKLGHWTLVTRKRADGDRHLKHIEPHDFFILR